MCCCADLSGLAEGKAGKAAAGGRQGWRRTWSHSVGGGQLKEYSPTSSQR